MDNTTATAGATASTAVPLPARLDKIEGVLQVVTGTLDKLGGVISALIPTAAPIVAGVDAVGHIAEGAIDAFEGKTTTDAAALAAGSIAKSTGNPTTDARLSEIEVLLTAAVPVLQYLAQQFGLEFAPATAAPMTAAVAVQGDAINGLANSAG